MDILASKVRFYEACECYIGMPDALGELTALMKYTQLSIVVYLNDIDDSIIVDLKYYSNENFTGQFVDGYLSNTAILTKESALALSDAQDDFNKLDIQ